MPAKEKGAIEKSKLHDFQEMNWTYSTSPNTAEYSRVNTTADPTQIVIQGYSFIEH